MAVTGIDEDLLRRLPEGPDLRVHSALAGVEHLPLASMAERGVLLTNSAGAYATAMAEYALAAMIMLARNLPGSMASASALARRRRVRGACAPRQAPRSWYGAVGRELAASASARHGGVGDEAEPVVRLGRTADRLLPASDLAELLGGSDFVVLCASPNTSTHRLIGEAELATMKPSAVLVNVARRPRWTRTRSSAPWRPAASVRDST